MARLQKIAASGGYLTNADIIIKHASSQKITRLKCIGLIHPLGLAGRGWYSNLHLTSVR